MEILYKHSKTVHNLNAPLQVVPVLMSLFHPESILDAGCGTGTWLKVFQDSGIKNICGIDGDYVKPELLLINETDFIKWDLRKEFNLQKNFDLVLSLEVAEHLPESVAQTFIASLCRHGDTILFSAAIPGQGGQNHLNEQWQEYWAALFRSFGYSGYDIIRPLIWNNENVFYWYRQNIMVYSTRDLKHLVKPFPEVTSYVHPNQFQEKIKELNWQMQVVKDSQPKGIRQLSKALLAALLKKFHLQ